MNKELSDRAWRVLPAEFRKEVKEIYNADDPLVFPTENELFDYIFGEHNLTSDAEGEEMLTVSRKQVQELYEAMQSEQKCTDVYNQISAEDRAAMLYALFGSKCLSEEVTKMEPIKTKVSVYLATQAEDKEFRQLLHENGFRWHTGDTLTSLSFWSSSPEKTKTYYLYPHKIVTHYGEKTSYTLTFSEFKKQYFGEAASSNVNNSDIDIDEIVAKGDVPDPAKQFDTIIKDGFSKERRLNIAAMAMQGILANSDEVYRAETCSKARQTPQAVAEYALACGDALIAKCGSEIAK